MMGERMTILLFGVSNVGKTTVGGILAHRLGYDFYDLDDEVKKYYNTTLEDFVNTGTLLDRDRKRGCVIDMIMKKREDKVFVISPISYSQYFNRYLAREDVLAIELQDSLEHIFERLVFSDENDREYKDDEYKNAHKQYYISEIKKDILGYRRSFAKVENKFYMDNDTAEMVVERIIKEYRLDQGRDAV